MEEIINNEPTQDYERTYQTNYNVTAETSDNLSVLFELDKIWSYLFAGEQRGVGVPKDWEDIKTLFELVQEKLSRIFIKTIVWNMYESRDDKGQTTEIDI